MMVTNLAVTNGMDSLAGFISSLPPAEAPVRHRFTKGLYIREIFMPRGAVIVSKIHKTEHPFVVSMGHVEVYDNNTKTSRHIFAPYCGVTTPGTQRALLIHEDTVWLTFHPTDKTSPEEIEKDIIAPPNENSITIDDEAMRKLKLEKLK